MKRDYDDWYNRRGEKFTIEQVSSMISQYKELCDFEIEESDNELVIRTGLFTSVEKAREIAG